MVELAGTVVSTVRDFGAGGLLDVAVRCTVGFATVGFSAEVLAAAGRGRGGVRAFFFELQRRLPP